MIISQHTKHILTTYKNLKSKHFSSIGANYLINNINLRQYKICHKFRQDLLHKFKKH